MTVWIVTTQAREETATGIIQRVYVRCWGAYSTEARATQLATKYGGTVTELSVDAEQGVNLQQWVNPGYTSE